MKTKSKTVPFVYKWVEITTGKWYIGSHYSKGCHPEDGYICSSKIVKKLIKNDPQNWSREILEVFDCPHAARKKEAQMLQEMNACMDPMSYNQTNADGKFYSLGPHSPETREKMKLNHPDFSGKNNPMYGKPGPMKGKKHKDSSKQAIGEKLKGRPTPPERAKKISEALTGLSWINDGITSRKINLEKEPVPDGWNLGMLEEHSQKMAANKSGEKHWNYGRTTPDTTRRKIAESIIGTKDSEETRLKKSQSSKKRAKIQCAGCGKEYLACHKRHHLNCSQGED